MKEGAISIGKFKNDTPVRDAGIILGEKIKDELNRNGYRWDFSTSGRYHIRGQILSVTEYPVSFTKERLGLEYELICAAQIEVLESATGKVAIKLDNFRDTSIYYAGSDPTYTRTNREIAVKAVMEKIAERFVILLQEL